MPFQLKPNSDDHGHYFTVAGRLTPGITLEQANARLSQSASVFRRTFPDWFSEDASFGVTRFQDAFVVRWCVVGAAFGVVGIRSLLAVNTAGLPRIGADGSLVTMDWRVPAVR